MSKSFKPDLTRDDVTPREVWLNRRQVLQGTAGAGVLGLMGSQGQAAGVFADAPNSRFSTDAEPNSFEDITTYNNFYEFGFGKDDPSKHAANLTTRPWSLEIDGMCANPGTRNIDDLIATYPLEERIYRLRCVEAWSMVIPWIGFELGAMIRDAKPDDSASYVAFETLYRPEEMRGQKTRSLPWPYREGLRLDEALNPLTIMAVGLYDDALPNQNGAPVRLVVPWKYGFKSIKSIVRMTFTDQQPETTWNEQAPNEYGFYSNVNPEVSHPRWSQATERLIGGGLFAKRIDTLMFNGYGEYVADLYEGMDLSVYY
ncbi:MAG: protein-methionine-sulfoxide reductase catalytic subunit MsrP [Rhodobacteraceae bacterium]|nr:protein-methionine-sulfoxide reductase catalytic subunit MsrP [Paracoccaceae bacterium]